MNTVDIDKVIKYKQAHARELNAQAEMAELWATMTPEQRRWATSVGVDPQGRLFSTPPSTAGQ